MAQPPPPSLSAPIACTEQAISSSGSSSDVPSATATALPPPPLPPLDPSTLPCANLTLPRPGLTHDFRIAVDLNPKLSLGVISSVGGTRNWISFSGGNWTATWGKGTVEPGGQDSQIVEVGSFKVTMETAYLLKTNDEKPAYIQIRTRGFRTGPKSVLEKLQDPILADTVNPSEYLFRLYVNMETGDERYADRVNFGMWVGSGMRKGSQVIYDAYRIS